MTRVQFRARLWRSPGAGGWHFVTVPPRCAPARYLAWGRSPVQATIGGRTWKTSVWRGADGRVLLAVPKAVRAGRAPGARLSVALLFA